MSLINTEVKPFTATAYHNGEFVDVSDADLQGQVVGRLLLPGRLHVRLPDRARRPRRQLRRVPEARRRGLLASRPTRTSPTRRGTTRPTRSARSSTRMIGDPTGDHHPQLRRAARGPGPGRPRHLRDRPRRRDPDRRDHRRRHRPQRGRAAAQGQGRAVRRRAPGRGLPGQVGRGRRRPSPRRSTSSARSESRLPGRAAVARRRRVASSSPTSRRPRACSTPRSPQQLERTSSSSRARSSWSPSLDDSAKSAELRELLDEIAALSDTITRAPRRDDDARRPSFADQPRRHRRRGALRRHPARPRVHLARARRCCRSAATRRRPTPERHRADRGARGRLPLRDLLLARPARTAPTWCRRST